MNRYSKNVWSRHVTSKLMSQRDDVQTLRRYYATALKSSAKRVVYYLA